VEGDFLIEALASQVCFSKLQTTPTYSSFSWIKWRAFASLLLPEDVHSFRADGSIEHSTVPLIFAFYARPW
jgi:hypothetical protein